MRDNFLVKTRLTNSPLEAAEFLKLGGIVAFPTETVYGLGADIFNERAIARIFEAKRRPSDNPLIAHVGSVDQIGCLASNIPANAGKFIGVFFPGPLTVVLPKSEGVPLIATAGLDTIGVRMPANDTALEFLLACGNPVAAPSANLSGRPSPTTWQAVLEDLDGRIDCILEGELPRIGLESTVVDCTSEFPVILRLGAVTVQQLHQIVPETQIYTPQENEAPRSPGVKHKHYSPRARVILVENGRAMAVVTEKSAFIGLTKPDGHFEFQKICGSVDEYAGELFEFFRECDRRNLTQIFCEKVDEKSIGAALMDRLRRAASA